MNYELLSYLLKASLVLAILTTAYAWLVKRETFLQVNRWLLWINVAATLLLPIIPLPDLEWVPNAPAQAVAVVLPPKPANPVSKVTKSEPFIAPSPQATTVPSEVLENSSLSVWDWIGIVYGVVAGLLVLKLLIQLGALWRLQHGSNQYETEDGVYLIESDKIMSPFSFFNRIFYNPTHHNDDEWAQVWAHECVHAHQLHSIDMLTAEVLKIVFWFNPFAWWHQRLVQETLEFITDRAVLDSGIEKKSYQYHLLRTTLSADKQTFTNHFGVPHFNKSLLKTRIEMMNKSKSKWMGVGKYFLFVAMLWVCAAFTKPYRAEIAAKIVEEVPELKAVMEPKPAQKVVFNDFVLEKPLDKPQKDSVQIAVKPLAKAEADTQTLVSSSKYVVYEDKTLHWVITPKTTLEDLFAMKQEFKRHNLELEVREMKMDPMQSFLQRVSVISNRPNGGSCAWDEGEDILKPIASHGGYMTIEAGGCGTTDKGNMHPTLKTISEQDEKTANEDFHKNRIEYLIVETNSKTGAGGSRDMRRKSLEYYKEKGGKSSFLNLNENDFLQVAGPHRNDIILLNGKPSTLEEIEKIALKDFYAAIFKDTWEKDKTQRRHYILIFTEN
jgi:beta-lactamase regulating signal transducer with metallopeptidase domain